MPVLDSYLFFNGNCAEAMRFYERTFDGKIDMMMTYGQAPDPQQCPAGSQDRIMHAHLTVDGRTLMASDTPKGQENTGMSGFALSMNYPTVERAKRVFDALADGGKVMMPLGKTFWSETFGMLTDRFGVGWMVSGGASM
jgi:PhnB protein